MEEIWKEVVGFEGQYEVSDQGRVRSLNYHRTGQTKVLKPGKNRYGYLFVGLCKDGKLKYFRVHRLVAQAFLPNPQNLPEVNHKNEDKCDNRAVNLEWCNHRYNLNYGTHNERMAKALINHRHRSKPILQYDKSGVLVKEWPSVHEVERQTGWANGNISSCCLGRHKSAYGFVWRHSDDVFPDTVQDVLF